MNSVKIYDSEIIESPFTDPEMAMRQLLKQKGVPVEGQVFPRLKEGFAYESSYSFEDFSTTIKWSRIE